MRVTKKRIRNCKFEGIDNKVLEIEYSHEWETWMLQIKDFGHIANDKEAYKYIIKQLRKQVTNLYIQEKMKA